MPKMDYDVQERVTVERIIFQAPESGFAIFRANPGEEGDPYVAKGHVGGIGVGDELRIWGNWEKHPQYGDQVRIASYAIPEPGAEDISTFLASGFIKGVGQSLAQGIVQRFGERTAEVLDNNPQRLLEVPGIGSEKLESIKVSWRENSSKRRAVSKLQEWGIGPLTIQKILSHWDDPDQAVAEIEEDPYLLAWDIEGIGFATADRLAGSTGIAPGDPSRLRAGLAYCLQDRIRRAGHCYLPASRLVEEAADMLDVPHDEVSEALDALCGEGGLIREGERIFPPGTYWAEEKLAKYLSGLSGEHDPYAADELLAEFETENAMELDARQRDAVLSALENQSCVITGGPGTGKTTIIRAILSIAQRVGLAREEDIALVAPTGRAAKRLEDSSGHAARTIHRHLGYSPHDGFSRHEDNPLPERLIICDEASMLDLFLATALVSALPGTAGLILVGDVHQLPPVGQGNVLRDIIASGFASVIELETVYRQGEGSRITRSAHAIKNGDMEGLNLSVDSGDFAWVDLEGEAAGSPGAALEGIVERLVFQSGFEPMAVQVLTPMYKARAGVREMNGRLQKLLNPDGRPFRTGQRILREGDKVMQIRNNYDKEVFNGDQGMIRSVEEEDGRILVDFPDRSLVYELPDLEELVLAYACTVHKAQGCEFPAVVMPLLTAHYVLLQRNLVYTGVTRARNMCILAGQKKALGMALANNKPIQRNTRLQELLTGRPQSSS
ncbi:MAG: ATP-dependent RecD-like DNA helicase [Desulfohalobiaceae bacterium]|nr:ATP-dependent RecD-like DNA helicase [Desulfohalobiaceae bacterium]